MTFKVGDTVTPIGWLLPTEKPTGIVRGAERNAMGQRILLVDWSDGHSGKVAEAIVEACWVDPHPNDEDPPAAYVDGEES